MNKPASTDMFYQNGKLAKNWLVHKRQQTITTEVLYRERINKNTTDVADERSETLTAGLLVNFTGSSQASRRVSRTMEGGEKPILDSPTNDLL